MNRKKIKFAFRVNGNQDIGMGHCMRCLYLAEHLPGPALFLINDNDAMAQKVKAFGHECRILASLTGQDFEVMVGALESYPKPFKKTQPTEAKELQEIRRQLAESPFGVLITDLLSPSDSYLHALKGMGVFLVSIDELGKAVFPSDLVFNCNAVSSGKKYKTEGATKVYWGKEYTLLKSGFLKNGGCVVRKGVEKVLVTCGGTDMKGLSLKVLRALKNVAKEIEVVLIKGLDFKFEEELNALLRQIQPIRILQNIQDMREVMLSADIAMASGGTTMYELAALGVPSIILDQYEHQNEFAAEMEREGALINLGLGEKAEVHRIEKAVLELLPYRKRKEMSAAAKKTIDGRGAQRVAHIIEEMAA